MSSTIAISSTHTNGSSAASSASVYGTTPGGTPRISYSRDQLLNLASSPLSRSPPNFDLPAAISRRTPKLDEHTFDTSAPAANANIQEEKDDEEEAFAMDL